MDIKKLEIKNHPNYYIDSLGNVYGKGGKKLKLYNHRYQQVNLYTKGIHKTYLVHRLMVDTFLKDANNKLCDHINGNKLDNRLCNLRLVSSSENIWNSKKQSNNKSGFKGVVFLPKNKSSDKKWASIIYKGNFYYRCLFSSKEEAYIMYCLMAHNLFGEYAHE